MTDEQLLILEILHTVDKEMYGLEIAEASNGKLQSMSIFVCLYALVKWGLISCRLEKETDSNPRGFSRGLYRISNSGTRILIDKALSEQGLRLAFC